jgi:hypothetical protein
MHLRLLPPAANTGRAGHDPSTTTARRALGSAAQKEPTAMLYTPHQGPGLPQIYAESRRHDLMAEAARARLANQATRGAAPRRSAAAAVTTLRRQIGSFLVQAGERVQGAGACPPADAGGVGTLRTAR